MDDFPLATGAANDQGDQPHDGQEHRTLSRRTLFAAAGLGVGLVMAPTVFAAAAPGSRTSRRLTGRFDPGAADFVYVPVDVPDGVSRISVSYKYSVPRVPAGTPGNSCDIGIFDARGVNADGRGFRGWSGGSRTEFAISNREATPGYLPGPVMEGTWYIVLGPYHVAPQGMDWTIDVTLDHAPVGPAFQPQYPPISTRRRGRAWYRGDCHLHTVHSDGRYTPDEVAAGARAAGLDFMVSTEHNTTSSHGVWGPLAGDDLLIITGEEVTTRNGHWVALGTRPGHLIDWRYRSRDDVIARHIAQVHRDGGLAVAAHLYCPWIGSEWKFGLDGLDATEVWTGPWGWDDEAAVSTWANLLAEASRRRCTDWLPAMGNSDAHNPGNVIGGPHNVVLADSLSRDAILAGLRAGRSWIAGSSSIELSLTARSGSRPVGIGDRLRAGDDDKITVRLRVSGVPSATVRLLTDQGQMLQSVLPKSGRGTVVWRTTVKVAAFVRAEVRHPKTDGSAGGTTMDPEFGFGPMAALTNPIWFDIDKTR